MTEYTLYEKLVRTFLSEVAVNRAPTEEELNNACEMVKRMIPGITDAEKDRVKKRLQAALDVAMDVGVVIEKEYEPWLNARKNDIDFYYWRRYALYLEQDQHRAPGVIATIDSVSDRIVDLAGDPLAGGYLHRRGLLIGDVQSGKTANYIAVMNKAADVGFKVIILLTGTVESLRRQTQERVDEGFIGRSSKAYLQRNSQTIKKGVGSKDSTRFATGFTTESSDFRSAVVRNINASLHNMSSEPVVFVLKKNARTMQNLIDWLENYNLNSQGRIDLPLLLIDDEADNASINTKTENEPAAINKLIRKLLGLFLESSYIAVTATPFANIFILPEKTEDIAVLCVVTALATRLVLLPIEFGASRIALLELSKTGCYNEIELRKMKRMLRACAFTYVAGVLDVLLLVFLLVLAIMGGEKRKENKNMDNRRLR